MKTTRGTKTPHIHTKLQIQRISRRVFWATRGGKTEFVSALCFDRWNSNDESFASLRRTNQEYILSSRISMTLFYCQASFARQSKPITNKYIRLFYLITELASSQKLQLIAFMRPSNDVGGVDPLRKIVADGARNWVLRCLLRSKNGGKVGTASAFNTTPSAIEVSKKDVIGIRLVRMPNRPQRIVQRGFDDSIQENDSKKERVRSRKICWRVDSSLRKIYSSKFHQLRVRWFKNWKTNLATAFQEKHYQPFQPQLQEWGW